MRGGIYLKHVLELKICWWADAFKGSILALSGAFAPAPPKWEPLAVYTKYTVMPRPLPLGEVDLRSKDGEGEDADNDQKAYHKIFQNFPLPFYSFFIAS